MKQKNPRFMITVDSEMGSFFEKTSEKLKKPVSSIIVDLIKEAIELREDFYWSQIAEEAEKRSQGKQLVDSEDVWKKCGLE